MSHYDPPDHDGVIALAFTLLDCPDWGRQDAGRRLMYALGRCGSCGRKADAQQGEPVICNGCPGRRKRGRKPPSLWTCFMGGETGIDGLKTWYWNRCTAEGRDYWRNR